MEDVLIDLSGTLHIEDTAIVGAVESLNITGNPRGFNKERSSKFRVSSRVRQTPEEGWRAYRPKRCGNNNKNEDNSPKTLNDKNHQALSQKFRHSVLSHNFESRSRKF